MDFSPCNPAVVIAVRISESKTAPVINFSRDLIVTIAILVKLMPCYRFDSTHKKERGRSCWFRGIAKHLRTSNSKRYYIYFAPNIGNYSEHNKTYSCYLQILIKS